MPHSTGHGTEGRTVSGVGTTSGQKALTAPANSFNSGDVGASVSGTGVPAGATIASVASGTSAQLSANATATGTVVLTVGPQLASSTGFIGWHSSTAAQETVNTVASKNAGVVDPARLTDSNTRNPEPTEQ